MTWKPLLQPNCKLNKNPPHLCVVYMNKISESTITLKMQTLSLPHGPGMHEGLLTVLSGQFEQLGPNTLFLTPPAVFIDFLICVSAS